MSGRMYRKTCLMLLKWGWAVLYRFNIVSSIPEPVCELTNVCCERIEVGTTDVSFYIFSSCTSFDLQLTNIDSFINKEKHQNMSVSSFLQIIVRNPRMGLKRCKF